MFKVFVSYSTHDLKNVAELQQSLSGTGVEVFVAQHSVIPGEHLPASISAAISACDLFVLLWSDNAKGSEWVSQEIGRAHALKKRMLPLILTKGLSLPGFIKELKYLPVYENPSVAIEEARSIVLEGFQAKLAVLEQQKKNEGLALLGIGALILWAMSQG